MPCLILKLNEKLLIDFCLLKSDLKKWPGHFFLLARGEIVEEQSVPCKDPVEALAAKFSTLSLSDKKGPAGASQ